nr:photosynthetic NDH subunit of lumenal location 1, chloroplastic [Ipomoea batatas]
MCTPVPERFSSFVDKEDGYAYYYPSDWTDFDFRGHDSAFKDRHLQLQNVRVSFIPTEQADIHDLGPMQEVMTLNFVIFIFFFFQFIMNLLMS